MKIYDKDDNKDYNNIKFLLKWIFYMYSEVINNFDDEEYYGLTDIIIDIEDYYNIEKYVVKSEKKYFNIIKNYIFNIKK